MTAKTDDGGPEYTTNNLEANLMLMRALNEIQWWDQMKELAPLVVKELIRMGVKFPPANAMLAEGKKK
jgi:hypothetical protein